MKIRGKEAEWAAVAAAMLSLGGATWTIRQGNIQHSEIVYLESVQSRMEACLAIGAHHFGLHELFPASGGKTEITLDADDQSVAQSGPPYYVSSNLERGDRSLGMARELTLCVAQFVDTASLKECIRTRADSNISWKVFDLMERRDPPEKHKGKINLPC